MLEANDWKSNITDIITDLTPGAIISILFLIFVTFVGLFAPWLAPLDYVSILYNGCRVGISSSSIWW
jgi:hypothetical protein